MKVIIISHEPYSDVKRNHYFMDEFRSDGHIVEYWCVQKAVKYASKAVYDYGNQANDVFVIERMEELLDRLNNVNSADTLLCIELWFNWDTWKIFTLIHKKALNCFSVDWYANQPPSNRGRKLVENLKALDVRNLSRAAVSLVRQRLFQRYARMNHISQPPLCFIPGQKLEMNNPEKEVISFNHHDYERVLTEDGIDTPEVKQLGNYAVFLDINLPGHPDLKRIGAVTISSDTYYKKLNTFFSAIEKTFNVQVVIAAHPKSSYTGEFGNRVCIKNKTRELVKHSSFVLLHHSFSINYAILYNKPALFFYTSEFTAASGKMFFLKNIHEMMKSYAAMLNAAIINIDEPSEIPQLLKPVDEQGYAYFRNNYIVSGKGDLRNYAILKEGISRKFKVTV